MTIGRDTTRATSPLRPDGTVDYVAALNEPIGRGVTPDDNASVLLVRVIHPGNREDTAERLQTQCRMLGVPTPAGPFLLRFIEAVDDSNGDASLELRKATSAPWRGDQHPRMAEWLKGNDAHLDTVREASDRPRLYLPLVSTTDPPTVVDAMYSAPLSGYRTAAIALCARSMRRLGSGDYEGFERDLFAVYRLARLVSQGPMLLDRLVAVGLGRWADETTAAAAASGRLTAEQIQQLRRAIPGFPPPLPVGDTFDLGERYLALDIVTLLANRGSKPLQASVPVEDNLIRFWAGQRDRDWDPGLRRLNGWYDRLAAASRLPTLTERRAAAAQIERGLQELRGQFSGWRAVFVSPEDYFTILYASGLGRGFAQDGVAATSRQLSLLALALAAYKLDHGGYPVRLDDLAPAYLDRVPPDAFDQPLKYERTDGGYVLYSVGSNGKDDRDREQQGKITDDIVIRAGPPPKPADGH